MASTPVPRTPRHISLPEVTLREIRNALGIAARNADELIGIVKANSADPASIVEERLIAAWQKDAEKARQLDTAINVALNTCEIDG